MPYSDEQLRAYFTRIGAGGVTSSLGALAQVQRAHRLAIAFENLDIPLGRGIRLDPEHLFDKLVTRRRGGYCFEQNALLLGMLHALGFEARPLLARVWLRTDPRDPVPPRSHTLNLVTLDGIHHIADAGFGGSYAPPMPLVADEISHSPDGARHRLVRDREHGWMLQRDAGEGWERQYSFTTERIWPSDLEAANHWTASRPDTRFTRLRIVSRALPDGYASLVDRQLTLSHAGESQTVEVAGPAQYRELLHELFGLDLQREEVDALGLFNGGEE
ncbi:MAG TPA: arylamine N-acetyltransferase [Allosphingosinicella sp.]|jgi:N-hydroxyarylamine O-acetyltransferase|uniref:arylamine N-acetyltransferase family protein n=1 Tax=Allosphingosinicella sp. TaxID=2823234 RepID=UPI002F278A99